MGDSKFYDVNIYGQQPLLAGGLGIYKFRNMKCSRSDSRPILGLLRAIDRYTVIERLSHGCI